MRESLNSELKVIIVRGSRGDLKYSEIEIDKLYNIKWRSETGGYKEKQGYYFLSGQLPYDIAPLYVSCSGLHNGEDVTVKVCIPVFGEKNYDIHLSGYKELVSMAGPKPVSKITQGRPKAAPPCTTQIKLLLASGPMTRGELRSQLLALGYQSNTILNAIRSLTKQELISLDGSSSSPSQIINLKN